MYNATDLTGQKFKSKKSDDAKRWDIVTERAKGPN